MVTVHTFRSSSEKENTSFTVAKNASPEKLLISIQVIDLDIHVCSFSTEFMIRFLIFLAYTLYKRIVQSSIVDYIMTAIKFPQQTWLSYHYPSCLQRETIEVKKLLQAMTFVSKGTMIGIQNSLSDGGFLNK